MAVTLTDVEDALSRPKILVGEMVWTARRGKLEFAWLEGRIPLQFCDEAEVRESFFVMCSWKRREGAVPEQWKYAVMLSDARILAIDVQPVGLHTNDKAGKGRPLYRKDIPGIHLHTWSEEGYGYAEPIEVPLDKPDVIWKMFLKRANIISGEFFHPDQNQPGLL